MLEGAPIVTHAAVLAPVRWRGAPAMLKAAHAAEERRGARLLDWWDGDGAARVFAIDGGAALMERAVDPGALGRMARGGRDDEATGILCGTIARLHRPRSGPHPADLVPLPAWFAALDTAARAHGGILARSQAAAERLLADPRDGVVLHGDIHHGNVLDFGARGWLAIDPKGLLGERGFDYANLFRNPDAGIALAPGRLRSRAEIVAAEAGLDWERLLRWALAYAGLSAAWSLEDGDDPAGALEVATIAAAELWRRDEDG